MASCSKRLSIARIGAKSCSVDLMLGQGAPEMEHDFDTIAGDTTNCLVGDLKSSSISHCFFFCPSMYCSFSRIILPIIFCAFMNASRLSSSFLLITIYGSIQYMGVYLLSVGPRQDALGYVLLWKCSSTEAFLSQNTQIAFLAQPFLGSGWFVTAKYCQT